MVMVRVEVRVKIRERLRLGLGLGLGLLGKSFGIFLVRARNEGSVVKHRGNRDGVLIGGHISGPLKMMIK